MFSLIRLIDIAIATADSSSTGELVLTVAVPLLTFPPLLYFLYSIFEKRLRESAHDYFYSLLQFLKRGFELYVGLGYYVYYVCYSGMRRLGYRPTLLGYSRFIHCDEVSYEIVVQEDIWRYCTWTVVLYYWSDSNVGQSEKMQISSCRNVKSLTPCEVAVYYESELLETDLMFFSSRMGVRAPDSMALIQSRTPELQDWIVKGVKRLESDRD